MHIFASPCFGRKPKAKVMIWYYQKNLQQDNVHVHHLVIFRSMEQELLNFKWLSSLEINLTTFHKRFEIRFTSICIVMDDLT